ncbi:hypothetical protein AB3662_04500 [Sorangium cellulosum]
MTSTGALSEALSGVRDAGEALSGAPASSTGSSFSGLALDTADRELG